MKVLFIEPCYENYGGYFRAFGMAKALSKKKIKVNLVISSKEISFKIKKRKINENLIQYELPRISKNFFINGRILRGLLACLFVLLGKYDLIHTFAIIQFESNIPFLLCKILGKKVVVDWDDYWTEADKLVPLYKKFFIIQKYFIFCENKLQRLTKNITVTSSFLTEKAKSLQISNILKIINGVDLEQFNPMPKSKARKILEIKPNTKIVLSFGHTFFKDRILLLFKTFNEINHLDKNIRFWLNYDPSELLKDQHLTGRFNPKFVKTIENLGYLDPKKLPKYLGAADMVLFMMGNYNTEKACFPTRIGTYLNGEKIIAMNKTDTEACHMLEYYKCAIIEDNPTKIAKRVINVLNNPELKTKLERKVIKARDDLSWDKLILNLIDFYKKILHNHKFGKKDNAN